MNYSSINKSQVLESQQISQKYSRKGSWTNFLHNPIDDKTQMKAKVNNKKNNKTFELPPSNKHQNNQKFSYNIEDFLPKRDVKIKAQSIDNKSSLRQSNYLALTSKFPQQTPFIKQQANNGDKLKKYKSSKEAQINNNSFFSNLKKQDSKQLNQRSLHIPENYKQMQNLQYNKSNSIQKTSKGIQQLIANAMMQRVQKLKNKLGWSQRVQLSILPKKNQLKSTSSQTDFMQEIRIQSKILDIQNLKTRRDTNNYTGEFYDNRNTPKDYNLFQKQNQKNTANKIPPLPKRIKKQYMEIYPVKINQLEEILQSLMSNE